MQNPTIQQIALHYSLLLLSETDGRLVFGTINSENVSLRQELEFLLSREVQFVQKTEAEILASL